MKYKLFVSLMLFTSFFCTAQSLYLATGQDSLNSKKERRNYQYIGVQANQLLNQLFSFGNTTTPTNNPYLIVFSTNSKLTGWGYNAGLGYTINSTTDNSDPNTQRKDNINNFSVRFGLEKKQFLSKKWMASYGFDLLYNKQGDDSNVVSQFQFNSNTSDSNTSTKSFGGGPRMTLNYFITTRIILGTEATYYYKYVKVSDKITNTSVNIVTDGNGNQTFQTSSSTSDTSTKSTSFSFQAPLAIFLIVKL
jgi:hypothetical protein